MTTIYFDLDGTVIRYDRSDASPSGERRERFASLGERPLEHFRAEYYRHRTDDDSDPFEVAARETVEAFDLDLAPERLARDVFEFSTTAGTVPETTARLLATLGERYELGVLTNGHRVEQVGKLAHHGLEDAFDAVITASDVGALKPDPRTFERAKSELPADEYVFVGDDVEADLPAGEHGFRTAILSDDPVPDADLVLDGPESLPAVETMLD